MEVSELIIAGVGIIGTVVTGWTTHYFTRKKYNTEVDAGVITNLEHSLDFYRKLVDDNTERLNKVIERNKELEEEVQELRKQVLELSVNVVADLREKGKSISKSIKPMHKLAETKTIKTIATAKKENK